MTQYDQTAKIGAMTAVTEMVEALIAVGAEGLPADWRDDFHSSPVPGAYLAEWLYNLRGPARVCYAARAASRSVRFDFCQIDGPDLQALVKERNRVVRLLSADDLSVI
jgi:hypothetical protein